MKKNKSIVQNILTNCLAFIGLLAGCAGFTEDGNASCVDIIDEYADQFAAARVTASGSVKIDEVNDSVTIFLDVVGGCLKRGESFVYDPNYYFVDKYDFAYKFRNDTLLLSFTVEDVSIKEVDTGIWVGGSSGKLDGTWLLTQCMYVNDEYGCGNEGYNKYLKIDGNKAEYRADDRADYNYMNSVFVVDLFHFFGSASSEPNVKYVFYGSQRVDKRAEEYGITIQEKKNKSMKFTYDNREFDLNVNYARYRDSVSVSLSSGGITCVGNYSVKYDVPPELCRDENAEYLQHSRYDDSESEALRFEKNNEVEFGNCINGILGRERTY